MNENTARPGGNTFKWTHFTSLKEWKDLYRHCVCPVGYLNVHEVRANGLSYCRRREFPNFARLHGGGISYHAYHKMPLVILGFIAEISRQTIIPNKVCYLHLWRTMFKSMLDRCQSRWDHWRLGVVIVSGELCPQTTISHFLKQVKQKIHQFIYIPQQYY